MKEKDYWVWLQLAIGVGNQKVVALRENYDTAKTIYENRNTEKMKGLLSKQEWEKQQEVTIEDAKALREKTEEKGYLVISYECEDYPEELRNIYNPPCVIYGTKNFPNCNKGLKIAVVGRRKLSAYGAEGTKYFCEKLAERGVIIVSGLAYGADTLAHKMAVEKDEITIGVLGCGLDITYPKSNEMLRKLMEQKGAVISEFPLGTPPHGYNFPIRNRIISGLCKGVLIVEAGDKSGTLITAKYAFEDGRDVFAIPSNIFASGTQGCNTLIKRYAKLVSRVEDILEEYGYDVNYREEKIVEVKKDILSEDEQKVLEELNYIPQQLDILVGKTGYGIGELNGLLFQLELKGYIDGHAGKTYTIKL